MLGLFLVFLGAAAGITAKPHTKIIGGLPAKPGQFPYTVALQNPHTNYFFCGASIIHESYLLTAASCVYGMKPDQVVAYVGSVNLNSGGVYYNVSKLIMHMGFDPFAHYDDIGLVKLTKPIEFNENVKSISLYNISVNAGEKATAVGWGDTSFPYEGRSNNELQYLTSTIMDKEKCSLALGTEINLSNLCFDSGDKQGICYEDFGNPLIYEVNNSSYVIGIASWNKPCATKNPDMYTEIPLYVGWIQGQINIGK